MACSNTGLSVTESGLIVIITGKIRKFKALSHPVKDEKGTTEDEMVGWHH